jgi:hypothetical protein
VQNLLHQVVRANACQCPSPQGPACDFAYVRRAIAISVPVMVAQAFLFYCFVFGQSLLFLERGPRKRARLIAKAAGKLFDEVS